MYNTGLKNAVRKLIGEHVKLPVEASNIGDADDLYDLGMTSHSSVMLMLGLENEFDVEFSDAMLTRDSFSSVDAIVWAISRLRQEEAA